jgi:hypothetical protein
MKKLIILLLMFLCSTSHAQVPRVFTYVKADSLDERVSGSGIKIKNSNLQAPKINDSTIQTYVETHGSSGSPGVIHDSLVSFQLLESNHNLLRLAESSASDNIKIYVNYPDVTHVFDVIETDLFGLCYWLDYTGLNIANSTSNFQFSDQAGLDIMDINGGGVSTNRVNIPNMLQIPQLSCSLTDGAPTASELGTCINTNGGGIKYSSFLVKDSDGSALLYRIDYDGTSFYYQPYTLAL